MDSLLSCTAFKGVLTYLLLFNFHSAQGSVQSNCKPDFPEFQIWNCKGATATFDAKAHQKVSQRNKSLIEVLQKICLENHQTKITKNACNIMRIYHLVGINSWNIRWFG